MTKKALVVDDNAEFAETMKDILNSNGYDVVTADTGKSGYEKAVEENPDLIILDVMMENDGAGLDAVKKLFENEATKNIPVFLLTGIRKPWYLLDSYEPGKKFTNVKGCLEKPVDPYKFSETLARLD